ncbi:bifunctional protein-serine/threonine kinase/phosphatase [Litchfieldella xinjiangensis]|uniref:bifunctional protein-serine/threonine kinase/phosphatase n=1 Tax=Litchfieldella xinjiangensis TaxID=1166948 RepID=UPI000693FC00|nr:bifunctional protein-serine/threonine kinase/phosphatase [Halomonas xinjiangensis]
MTARLSVSVGQYSDKGQKAINQDFHGLCIPDEPQLSTKGIAIALADGISSSDVSQIASEAAVGGFLEDYYCTSEAWSVKTSAQRVLMATNSWLHAQSQRGQHRFDMDRGYVCTFSALVIKAHTAHLFHVGDTRVYRLRDNQSECLTQDHRLWVSQETSYLSRALGINTHLEIDYTALPVEAGDIFVFLTDGVYEFLDEHAMVEMIRAHRDSLDEAASMVVNQALANGSTDNLTAQIVRVDTLPRAQASDLLPYLDTLPSPPMLEPRMRFEGYRILRQLHASSRSHVHLAVDEATGATVVLKTPSIDLRDDAAYRERFMMEEWIARRIDSPHVLKPYVPARPRESLYTVAEYVEGQTLDQWMRDHPSPDLETVRGLVEQIAKGLRAFHRLEMLHQDLRPANVMIDSTGTVKIIDFGATQVAGIHDMQHARTQAEILGTAPFTAPEYFLGDGGSTRSDQYSLGVIAYTMLTGRLPYGTQVSQARTRAAQKKLSYRPACDGKRGIPLWVDEVLRKAVHPDPHRRYIVLSEFTHELRHPSEHALKHTRPPLMERDPVLFWKCVSLVLALMVIGLLVR